MDMRRRSVCRRGSLERLHSSPFANYGLTDESDNRKGPLISAETTKRCECRDEAESTRCQREIIVCRRRATATIHSKLPRKISVLRMRIGGRVKS